MKTAALAIAILLSACAATDGATQRDMPPAAEPTVDMLGADLRSGAGVYQSLCAFCHGDDGRGGTGGGTSLRTSATPQDIIDVVVGGRNMMPSLSNALSEAQIRDVAAYIVDRFHTEAQ